MDRNVARFMRGMAMALGVIELQGFDIACFVEGEREHRFPAAAALVKLTAWSARYDSASQSDDEAELAAIGREMFAWLDEAGWASAWHDAAGDRTLEIRVTGRREDLEREAALLDTPWELLATAEGPLALDAIRLFIIARRVGEVTEAFRPKYGDLQLMFMAAAPAGQSLLDFEAEEAAILEATRRANRTHLIVEETGALEPLGIQLTSDDGPFDALHLSCHGEIDTKSGQPFLLLESVEGGAHRVFPDDLVSALGEALPPLVMLSACRTAERGGATTPFVRQLAAKFANVIGWDGSVYDRDAIDFAAQFYGEVANRSRVPRAAALGRRALLRLRADNPKRGRHWHLARVYLGSAGGGPLCIAGGKTRRRASDSTVRASLGRVEVASRTTFVGRRRALQAMLRALRGGAAGVLIHGMGAIGKSSAAARIANRMLHKTCVIFERYDALAMFDAILATLPPAERRAQDYMWREAVRQDSGVLGDALEAWLESSLDAAPILLIVDALDRILETPRPGGGATGVRRAWRTPLSAVLRAFARACTQSHLLITSRYDFVLPDGLGGDLTRDLMRVPLVPMAENERVKQLRAAERIAGREVLGVDEAATALIAEALDAAGGNPGLQAVLTHPILAGELPTARAALVQVSAYIATGVPPSEIEATINGGVARDSENALIAFFARLSLQTYIDALTEDEARVLSAATLFSRDVPIPHTALATAGLALGCQAPQTAITRLLGLSLLDDWGTINHHPHAAANRLVRPLALPIPIDQQDFALRQSITFLEKTWNSLIHSNKFNLEIARISALIQCPSLRMSNIFSPDGEFLQIKESDHQSVSHVDNINLYNFRRM